MNDQEPEGSAVGPAQPDEETREAARFAEAMEQAEKALRRRQRWLLLLLLGVILYGFGRTGWWAYRRWFYVPSTETLVERLGSPEALQRLGAVLALQERTDEDAAVRALAAALQDASATIRGSAAMALDDAGPRAAPAVGALIDATGYPDPDVRFSAIGALAATGVATESVVRALLARLDDPRGIVRWRAESALSDTVLAHPDLRASVEAALDNMPPERGRSLRLRLKAPTAKAAPES